MATPRYDSHGRRLDIDAEMTDMSKSAMHERMEKTKLGNRGKAAPGAPKQEPGESASSYAARYRKYRESAASQADDIEKRAKR